MGRKPKASGDRERPATPRHAQPLTKTKRCPPTWPCTPPSPSSASAPSPARASCRLRGRHDDHADDGGRGEEGRGQAHRRRLPRREGQGQRQGPQLRRLGNQVPELETPRGRARGRGSLTPIFFGSFIKPVFL